LLACAQEQMQRKYRLQQQGFDLGGVAVKEKGTNLL
jgi:hypothetical protein